MPVSTRLDALVPEQRSAPSPQRSGAPAELDDLVRTHLPLVRHVLFQVGTRFPRHADREDLAQAGAVGLVEAALRYDPARGVPFERWAALRIRGAILDAVRATDFAPRALRGAMREVEEARSAMAADLGRRPTDAEVAARLGISTQQLASIAARVHDALVLSLDAPAGDGEDGSLADRVADRSDTEPAGVLERRELDAYVRAGLELLPEDRRTVVVGYFLEGRSSGELARALGVTESRVSQLRSEGLALLRNGIAAQYGDAAPGAGLSKGAARRAEAYASALAERAAASGRLPG